MTTAFGRAKILLGEAVKEDQAGNAEEALKWYKQVCKILRLCIYGLCEDENTRRIPANTCSPTNLRDARSF